jgi:putative transposase
MSGKANRYWSKQLKQLTENRNRTMRDAINKAARQVINHSLVNHTMAILKQVR